MAIVTIIGAGMMGSALAFPARENGHEVRLVGTHLDRDIIEACKRENKHPKFNKAFPPGVQYYHIEDACAAIENADMIIGGVSSFGVEWFGDEILPLIPDSIPVLTVTKGLMDTEDGELLTYPQLWQQKLDTLGKKLELNAVGGPCTSYELVAHDQTEVAFCGKNMQTLKKLKQIMETDYYHISITNDVTGIESAVALKNGYALGIALTIGLNQKNFGIDSEPHFNSQAAVFGQALEEMYKLLDFQKSLTLHNLKVGIGDLYVTVYGGRTRLVGILLGRGLGIDRAKAELNGVTLESLVVAERVARAVIKSAEKGVVDTQNFPLLMHINEILTEKKPVNIPWDKFTYQEEIVMNYWTQSEKNIYVAAHRGWCEKYPENTILAFEKALELDVDQLELDVRITRDNELVVIHDATVDRTTNGSGKVCDMTLEELKQLDAGIKKGEGFTGCRIPTLIEFMELIKNHPTITVDFELKEYPHIVGDIAYEVCDRVLKIINEYGFDDRCVINSFSNELNEYIHNKYGDKYRQHVYYPDTCHNGTQTTNPYTYGYCVCMFGDGTHIATKAEFDEMKSEYGIQTWAGAEVRDEPTVDEAIDRGAQLITCNNPDVILELLRKKGYHK